MLLTVATSHNLMDLSSEPDARILESGLQEMVEIPARCPSRVCSSLPVLESQILIVASAAMALNQYYSCSSATLRHTHSSLQSIGHLARTSPLRFPSYALSEPISVCSGAGLVSQVAGGSMNVVHGVQMAMAIQLISYHGRIYGRAHPHCRQHHLFDCSYGAQVFRPADIEGMHWVGSVRFGAYAVVTLRSRLRTDAFLGRALWNLPWCLS